MVVTLRGCSDYLSDTLDRYNMDMKEMTDYLSDFWRFEVSDQEQSIEVFVSIAYGFSDSKLIAHDVGRGRLGHSKFDVECPSRKLIRSVVNVSFYTSENECVGDLESYYVV